MRAYLRTAASAVGVVAVLLVVALWVGSYWTFDRVTVPLKGKRMLVLISYQGRLTAVVAPFSVPEVWWERGDVHVPRNTYPDQLWPRKSVLGFGWITQTLYLNVPNPPVPRDGQFTGMTGRSWACGATGAMAPDWFIALLLAGLAALPWLKRRYSVRTLLAAMTLTAVVLGIFTMANRAPLEKLPLD